MHCQECVDSAATFCLCTCPLLQELGDIPHSIAHCLLREVCSICRANPVQLKCVFKVGAAKESNNCSSGSVRQCTYLERVNDKIVRWGNNAPHCSSVSSVHGSLGLLTCLLVEHRLSSAHEAPTHPASSCLPPHGNVLVGRVITNKLTKLLYLDPFPKSKIFKKSC